MPAALSQSEHIRRQLEQNFDLPAADVQSRLGKRGIEVEVGLVYQVRSKMKQEREAAEKQKQREAEQLQFNLTKQKVKLQANAAKARATRELNSKPLRVHILDALSASGQGMTLKQIVSQCEQTYIRPADSTPEGFEQSVRKKLRILVVNEEVSQDGKNFVAVPTQAGYTNTGKVLVAEPTTVPATTVPEGGIATLVLLLKQVVGKIGKQDTKELIDAL